MGTRGLLGFRIDNKDKLMYNHFDSYPDCLGKKVVKFCRKIASRKQGFRTIIDSVRSLRTVSKKDKPSIEDQEKLIALNLYNGTVSDEDWYCLLHGIQGNLDEYLRAGMIIDNQSFIYDSLFCEWAYIINLDSMDLEIYGGFRKEKHSLGRYGISEIGRNPNEDGYFPCALLSKYPLDSIPRNWMKEVIDKSNNCPLDPIWES